MDSVETRHLRKMIRNGKLEEVVKTHLVMLRASCGWIPVEDLCIDKFGEELIYSCFFYRNGRRTFRDIKKLSYAARFMPKHPYERGTVVHNEKAR